MEFSRGGVGSERRVASGLDDDGSWDFAALRGVLRGLAQAEDLLFASAACENRLMFSRTVDVVVDG